MLNIEGKVIIITGASSAIGEARAKELANTIVHAICQPDYVSIDEMIVRPSKQQ